jgi:lipopolysaccharide assembly outer membrane protein LptD (OstA)
MKAVLFIISFLPFLGFAQTKSPYNPIDGRVTCLHYDTAEVNGPVTINDDYSEEDILKNVKDDIKYRGNVEFKIGFTSIKCKEALSNDTKHSLTAGSVIINCLYYPVLKGDLFTYDIETKKATLTGHIILEDKGAVKSIGKTAALDLSHDKYVILSLK